MAIGDTVQAGLMRVDFSPFLEAGRANAAANASFGQALGQVAKGFIEGQQKKKRASEIAGFLMGQGVGEKDAMAIAKNPFLQNEYQRKQEAEAKMKMEQSRLATQSNIAAQGRAQRQAELEEGYRRQDEGKAETEAFYDRLNDTIATDELTPEAQQKIENFSSVVNPNDPRRSAQVNDPQAFMERVQNDPSSYVQKPVYELQGRDFLSQFEDPGMFQKALAFQQANQPKSMTPEELISLKSKILDFELKQNEESRKSTDFSDSESIKTFTPESNYLQLGTTKVPITGRLGSQTEAIKYKDEYIPNFNTTNETFEGLLALGQKRADGWYMESQEKDQAMSYVRQLQGLIREDILGPGTVQESERNILDNIVKNPTSWSINGAEENMKILKNLRQKIFNRLENRMKNFNLKLGDSNLTNTPKDQPDYTDETSSGNRIRIFDFDNLNQ